MKTRCTRRRNGRLSLTDRLALPRPRALTIEPLEGRVLLDGLGLLGGTVIDDLDRDGVRDPDEPGLANWAVELQRVGTTDTPELTFDNPTPDTWSQFGRFVAAVGDNVLVGSHYDDVAGLPDSGAAYLFDGSTGERLHTFVSPNPTEMDRFGRAVAGLGDNVLIGAPLDDTSTGVRDSGTVYLFDGETYELLHTLVSPNPRERDQFGRAVAAVGNNVLVGARFADITFAEFNGSPVLITEAGTGLPDFIEIQNVSNGTVDTSGWVVAANNAQLGNINDVHEPLWDFPASMAADEIAYRPDTEEDNIIWSTYGDGWVMIVDDQGNIVDFVIWGYSSAEIDTMEIDVGEFLNITPGDAWSGAAVEANDSFSKSLQRTGDADHDDASDWAFTEPPSAGVQNANLITPFSGSVSETMIHDAGAAYLFDGQTGELLQTYRSPTPSENAQFGYSVAAMGDNVLVGARWDETGADGLGAVYLFDGETGNLLQSFLNPTQRATGEPTGFGRSVAAVGDNVLVAARWDDSGADGAGSAFLFDGATAELLHVFNSPTPAEGEEFGFCVAALGNDVLVGARWDNRGDGLGEENGGAVYLFDGATGQLLQAIANPAPGAWDAFGISVAALGKKVIVGTQFGNAAYLFEGDAESQMTLTNTDGNYAFTQLVPGRYRIATNVQEGYVQTLPAAPGTYTVTMDQGGIAFDLDFGHVEDELPVAQHDHYTTTEDLALTVDAADGVLVNDSDADQDPLTASLVNAPPYGTVTLQPDGSFTYTPDPDFNGSDSFTYRANDGVADSNLATVTITVEPVNDAPVANDNGLWILLDTTRDVPPPGVLADDVDVDGDKLAALLVDPAAHGTVTLRPDGSFSYAPDLGYLGPDSFTYQASDGMVDSNLATVHITVSEHVFDTLWESLRITELNYHPYRTTPEEQVAGISDREAFEFIEMKNTGGETLDLAGVQFTNGIEFQFIHTTLLGPGEYALLVKDQFAFETRYGTGLNVGGEYRGDMHNSGEQLALKGPFDQIILDFYYDDNDDDDWPLWADGYGSTLEVVSTAGAYGDPSNWRASAEYGGSPGGESSGPSVIINEVLPHVNLPLTDSIELYNRTDTAIDVGGWYLSDSANDFKKYRIPDGTVLPSGGYLVFDEYDFNPGRWQPGAGGFALSGTFGDKVWLMAADASGNLTHFVDHVQFGAALNGESFGRWPNGTGELYPMSSLTSPGENSGPRVGPVIIAEVMYHPPDPGGGVDPDDLDFIEIHNPTGAVVDLTNWRIRGGVEFNFPEYHGPAPIPPDFSDRTTLDPGATIVLVGFDPANADVLAEFRSYYLLDDSVQIVGPFSGNLNNGGDTVRLMRADYPRPEEQHYWPPVLEDEVIYNDTEPWPISADGYGDSLHCRGRYLWGHDAANWIAAQPTPGTVDLRLGNLAISELNYNPYDPTDDELAVDPTWDNNQFEFLELLNSGQEVIDLEGVSFTEGVVFDFAAATMLGPDERVVIVKNLAAFQTRYGTGITVVGEYGGALRNSGEQITLVSSSFGPILDFDYDDDSPWPTRADGDGSSLELIDATGDHNDDANWRPSSEHGGSPGSLGIGPIGDVLINEVLTNTDPPLVDAIELYNTTDTAIDIGGWYLSDSGSNLRKFRIPEGIGIPDGGYVVFDESDFNPTEPAPEQVPFALDGTLGEEVFLSQTDVAGNLTFFADHVQFGSALRNESFGRWPNGEGDLYPMITCTLDRERPEEGDNSGPRVGPLIISEVMYHPLDPGGGVDSSDLEFIEIYNPTSATLDLVDWQICGGVEFGFPESTLLAMHARLVILRFDPTDTDRLATFRRHYGIDESVRVIGGYAGSLSNRGEQVQLRRADEPTQVGDPPVWITPYPLEDEVTYDDEAPWPIDADGYGDSLNRVGSNRWGDDPASWLAAVPSPGTVEMVAQVDGRYVFYNNSAFDTGLGQTDDDAIATDKKALLRGETATFANYTNYSSGINGMMVDIVDLPPAEGSINPTDYFEFKVGNDDNPSGWDSCTVLPTATVRPDEGVNYSDRVTLIWPEGAVRNQWLQVTVLANENTGFAEPDVFHFGNLIAETGDKPDTAALVSFADFNGFANHYGQDAPIDSPYDFNRDGTIAFGDFNDLANNYRHSIELITVPTAKDAKSPCLGQKASRPVLTRGTGKDMRGNDRVSAHDAALEQATRRELNYRTSSPAKADWLWQFEAENARGRTPKRSSSVETAVDVLLATGRP